MAFDPFGGGGNHGSHVTFAPIPIPGPSHQHDWGRPNISPPVRPTRQMDDLPLAQNAIATESQRQALEDLSEGARREAEATERAEAALQAYMAERHEQAARAGATIVETFASIMTEAFLDTMNASPSLGIARRLPGSPENVYGQMQAAQEDEKLTDQRRAFARQMAKKDDEMAYRE
jgi:hypothetical protein